LNIVFRVDSSTQIGLGHLMRCLALADVLKQDGCNVTFLCRALEGNSIEAIEHSVIVLDKNDDFRSDDIYVNSLGATQEQDANQTIKMMPKSIDLLVVDSYALGQEWHQRLRPHTRKILVIDDLADRQFDCDILLNQNLGVEPVAYEGKVPKDCTLLLGCNYALLRQEFSDTRAKSLEKRRRTNKVENILVSLGGGDVDNLTFDILQQIDSRFNVVVVLGKASAHVEAIQAYAKDKTIEVIVDSNNMAEIMLNADIAIGAGGSTSWERCCLGLPTLLYVLADNQRWVASQLEDLGAVIVIENLKMDLQLLVESPELINTMSNKSRSICDGLGCKRVSRYVT
jgi:UDP-2,4-diacetamido-2,4,6-trideoxy-beta-L-altropyranose hydrolase